MNKLQTIGAVIIVSFVSAYVLFFAVIGAVFVFNTEHASQDVSAPTCDKIERQSGILWCMNVMTAKDG